MCSMDFAGNPAETGAPPFGPGSGLSGRQARRMRGSPMAKPFVSINNITAGRHSFYNGAITIKGRGPIRIGSFCAVGGDVRIIAGNTHNMNLPAMQVYFYKKHFGGPYPGHIPETGITIGNDVWIGDGVSILDGSVIGDGCVLAAGAVVRGHVPDYTIAGGVPAKAIRRRFSDEVVALLQELRWWDWSEARVRANKDFFYADLTALSAAEIRAMICPEPEADPEADPETGAQADPAPAAGA